MADQTDPFDSHQEPRPRIAAVSLVPAGHLYNYLASDIELRRGDRVIVETEAGLRTAIVQIAPHEAAQTLDLSSIRPIMRVAGDDDLRAESEHMEREDGARRGCLERIAERRLPMKLVNVTYTLDGRKAIVYYAAETRVDFRDLVRDLASMLRVRIEMKQIGARDESKLTGAVGPCGRELCCSSWLRDFEAVTVKMAREQGLALNPSRLAGMCGRLKCCLRYEYATYIELKRALPGLGKRVESVKGDGKVIRHNVLKQTVMIQTDELGAEVEVTLEDLVEKRAP